MKRWIYIIWIVLLFALVSCAGTEFSQKDSSKNTQNSAQEPSEMPYTEIDKESLPKESLSDANQKTNGNKNIVYE